MNSQFLALILITAAAAMITGLNSGAGEQPLDNNPDFIIVFSGDLQGYLKECG